MSKKQFKDSPALAFIKPQERIHEHAHENNNEETQERICEHAHENNNEETQYHTQQEVQTRIGYIRTQGRKGFKKPRINLAFDSEIFLDKIRIQAGSEGKSITQFVNDVVADYLKKIQRKKKG